MPDFIVNRKAVTVLLLLVISSAGLYIRFDNISYWLDNKARYFSPSDNTPVPLSVDSYYYLDIAQDVLEGKIEKQDLQRQAPNSYKKTVPLPLLSLFLALGSKITGRPLEWIACLLPPFLAVLLAIPVYFLAVLLFRTSCCTSDKTAALSAAIAGLVSALYAVIMPAFVERSSMGWCDTDVMNVTFLCALALLAMRAALSTNIREQVFCLSSFTLLTGLFLLWWDQATAAVAAFSLGYFFLAALFSIGLQRKNTKVFAVFLLINCFLLFLLLGKTALGLPNQLLGVIKYTLSKDTGGMHFLSAGQLVAEQQDVTFALMAGKVAGSKSIFSVSLLGVALLALITRKQFLFLLPWLVLSLLSVKSHRLMIFSGVLFSLGMGTFVFLACMYIKNLRSVKMLIVLLVVAVTAWFPFAEAQKYFSRAPSRSPLLYDSFKQLAAKIPDGSIIWASWGHGHPLVYYTNARTIGDGIYHPPQLVYSQYVPFSSDNSRLAANWITFYATQGLEGLAKTNKLLAGNGDEWSKGIPALQELLGAGIEESRKILLQKYRFTSRAAEDVLSFIYPLPSSPIYILLDYVTFGEEWFPWGRMNLADSTEKINYTMIPVYSFSQTGSMLQGESSNGDMSFDLLQGVGKVGDTGVSLKQLRFYNGRVPFAHTYKAVPWAPTLMLNQNMVMKYGALVDDNVLNTLFSKMFFLQEYDEIFFTPVIAESPLVMVYQVKGETDSKRKGLNRQIFEMK